MGKPPRPLPDESKDKTDQEMEDVGLDNEGRPRDDEAERTKIPTPPPPD